MVAVLVLDSDASERAFALHALRAEGHDVVAPAEARPSQQQLARAQVVVAELDAAVAAGLFRDGAPDAAPLVVASRFATFLPALGGRVAAVVRKPLVGAALVDAVRGVVDKGAPAPEPPPPHVPDAPSLDSPTDPELYAIAELVSRGVGTPTGLVTVLSGDRQIFAGHVGLPPDLAAVGAMPRAWSLCHHAASAEAPLVVSDAREHPALAANPAVAMNLVRAYAGVPIEVPGFGAVGTVCVVSQEPRAFTQGDLAILELGARLAGARLARRFEQLPPPALGVPPTPPAITEGELLEDKYYVTGRLGDGGQSNVLFGRDRLTGQLVAIKVMRAGRGETQLVREAATLARVRHPNVVQVHGWGRTRAGQLYLVLEYVEGCTLGDRLAQVRATSEPLEYDAALKVVREIAGAVATLHGAGVVHGDLKPSNVILDATLDRAVLIDFGLVLGARARPRDGARGGGGTPGYSAPEQLVRTDSPSSGERADVYGLGALAYAALVGVGPFERVRGPRRAVAQLHGEVLPPSSLRAGLPEAVDRVLLRALAPDPAQRPASIVDLVDRLERAMAGAVPPSRKTVGFEPRSCGLLFRDYRRAVRAAVGEEAEAAVLASMPAAARDAFAAATDPHEFYPSAPLIDYLRAYARGDLSRLEALGESLSGGNLASALSAMPVTRSPESALLVVQPLMARFHDWGRIEVEMTGSDEARARLGLPQGFAPVMCHYLGGVARAFLALGGRRAAVRHEACAAEGAPACVLRIGWEGP
jgi:hypothetical protein